ncbi:UNVERIFIED_CONTAM: hypothetical protein RMT77_009246 [Armadillidium vulgare]
MNKQYRISKLNIYKCRKPCFYITGLLSLTLVYVVAVNLSFLSSTIEAIPETIYNFKSSLEFRDDGRSILCPVTPSNLPKKLQLKEAITLKESEKALGDRVLFGGSFYPPNCLARWKIAILVCFRDRDEHLGPFTYHLHNFLQNQSIQYTIYVVNQTDYLPFNRAKLFNVGYVETLKDGPFDCYVFHDVDFLPDDGRNLYYCSDMPRHMTVFYDNHPYMHDNDVFQKYFGGVVMLKESHLKMVNGWSNSYWGWGGEDDDMKLRIGKQNLTIWRYPKDIGHYYMLRHRSSPKNPIRYKQLEKAEKNMGKDGLNNLHYKLDSIVKHPLFTSINVNLTEKTVVKN